MTQDEIDRAMKVATESDAKEFVDSYADREEELEIDLRWLFSYEEVPFDKIAMLAKAVAENHGRRVANTEPIETDSHK